MRKISVLRPALTILVCLTVAACAGVPLKSDRQIARDRVEGYIAQNPATTVEIAAAMRRFELSAAMSKDQVAAVWGDPVEMQKWRNDTVDHWSFGCAWPNRCEWPDRDAFLMGPIRPQAFFRDGRLIEWSSP